MQIQVLTDEEIEAVNFVDLKRPYYEVFEVDQGSVMEFARAIEAAILAKLAKRLREGQTHDFTTGYLLDQSAVMDESADAIDALLDRLEKAEKDAERYRWLRDTGTQGFSNGVPQRGVTIAMDGSVKLHFVYWMTQQQLDKSIDEAMEASK